MANTPSHHPPTPPPPPFFGKSCFQHKNNSCISVCYSVAVTIKQQFYTGKVNT